MMKALMALGTGAAAGGVFAVLDLPVPAPPTIAGLMGIAGLFMGYVVVNGL